MSLNLLGRWIQDVVTSSDQIIKDLLLKELFLLFVNFFKKKTQLLLLHSTPLKNPPVPSAHSSEST
ncbi:10574_t:CDS:1, partial [Funneliformis geosporum]